MKYNLILSLLFLYSAGAYADAISDVKNACSGIKDGLNSIRGLAGASTGLSAGGVLAGGTALATGIMKAENDKLIDEKLANRLEQISASDDEMFGALMSGEAVSVLNDLGGEELRLRNKSQLLGNIRTGASAVGAATGAAGAITSGIGSKQISELIDKMNACNAEIDKLERHATELRFAGESAAVLDNILKNCKKYNVGNMEDIKKKMTISAWVATIAGGASLTGAITSGIANSKEKNGASATGRGDAESTKGLNLAANISAGVATGASIGSLALSAISLAKLNADAENAKNCESFL
jgi:hypothetical protein